MEYLKPIQTKLVRLGMIVDIAVGNEIKRGYVSEALSSV